MAYHCPGETVIHSSGLRTGHNVFRSSRPSGLNILELNMRFTSLACFLTIVTAAYAGTIEMRQGCPGTKVCPTNTVLICCKGINGPVDACFPPGVVC
ncbi:hypothetical protein C8R44DRAFT_985697 [Mycena epipterygia]|nr:hypothetical protein C8R44DRAFT_985697 [Mycena epipterygia]